MVVEAARLARRRGDRDWARRGREVGHGERPGGEGCAVVVVVLGGLGGGGLSSWWWQQVVVVVVATVGGGGECQI